MPDNLHTTDASFSALPELQIVTLEGVDAVPFAHAQFASDIAALPIGHWHWSTWLTAKGRVLAVFAACLVRPDLLLLALPDGDAEALAEQLRRFVFRRKVRIAARPELAASGALAAPPSTGATATIDGDVVQLDLGTPAQPRTLRIAPDSLASTPASEAFSLCWRQWDLRMGLPRLVPSQREQWTPQQLGLDRLQAYSVKKGCYPGQEIVARTHFLGKAKRATQLLELATTAEAGDAVTAAGQPLGSLASVALPYALAVLPLDAALEALAVHEAPAHAAPGLDGLAR